MYDLGIACAHAWSPRETRDAPSCIRIGVMCRGRRSEFCTAAQSIHLPARCFIVGCRGLLLHNLVFVSDLRRELDEARRAGIQFLLFEQLVRKFFVCKDERIQILSHLVVLFEAISAS